jgi:hypothetical protein
MSSWSNIASAGKSPAPQPTPAGTSANSIDIKSLGKFLIIFSVAKSAPKAQNPVITVPDASNWSNLPATVIKRHLVRHLTRLAESQVLRRVCKGWRAAIVLPQMKLSGTSSRSIPSIVTSCLQLTLTSPTSQQMTDVFQSLTEKSPIQVLIIEKFGTMDANATKALANSIQSGSNLMSLDISDGSISDSALTPLIDAIKSAKSRIISLRLAFSISSKTLSSIFGLLGTKPIRRLVLENCIFPEEQLKSLSQALMSPKCKLQGVTLHGALAGGISHVFEALKSNKMLHTFEIGDPDLDFTSLFSILGSNTYIKTLRLREGKVSATNLGELLAENSTLQELEMDKTHFFYDYEGDYSQSLERIASLKRFKAFGHAGELFHRAICKALQTNTTIESIDFTKGFRTPWDYLPIASFLGGENETLKEISIDLTLIDLEFATALSAALKKNRTLEKIHFKLNGKLFDGSPRRILKMILEALKPNPVLRSLRIEAPCEDDVTIVVANIIEGSQALTELFMPRCEIQVKGFTRVLEAISKTQCVKMLDMSYNDTFTANEAFSGALVRAIVNCKSLNSVVFRGTTLGAGPINAIVHTLKTYPYVSVLDYDLREINMAEVVRKGVDKLLAETQGVIRILKDK